MKLQLPNCNSNSKQLYMSRNLQAFETVVFYFFSSSIMIVQKKEMQVEPLESLSGAEKVKNLAKFPNLVNTYKLLI